MGGVFASFDEMLAPGTSTQVPGSSSRFVFARLSATFLRSSGARPFGRRWH